MGQHIHANEIDENGNENAQSTTNPSIFDRIQPPTLKKGSSVLLRIGKGQNPEPSMFWIVKDHARPKPSVFD